MTPSTKIPNPKYRIGDIILISGVRNPFQMLVTGAYFTEYQWKYADGKETASEEDVIKKL